MDEREKPSWANGETEKVYDFFSSAPNVQNIRFEFDILSFGFLFSGSNVETGTSADAQTLVDIMRHEAVWGRVPGCLTGDLDQVDWGTVAYELMVDWGLTTVPEMEPADLDNVPDPRPTR